ncbi:family 1 glycosylhydrolase [Paludicola sp. MB14-C6]|uniref:glycoside hydrolase family 1 protein n=1 Tax=Paludihabitans sp. MB14-C6 TaxID=3070656 RepID=UPI0027DE5988|nr:family 1 glycosylhydrolase [Paludicola sp. MB14-C6]WMJ24036.1 family 1 glycosylhydrolase [Paludicola sp. MB14-C6]
MSFEFKHGFSLGVASAATQIEGGECGHNWNDWYHQGKIKDQSNPARATDHYNLWQQDADLMSEMKIQFYRLGIEWARICPNEGEVDESVIAHYREELSYLESKGISVLLTIHHFTNPMWFEKKGGFLKKENMQYFLDFVALVVQSFGDLVSEYITINEPNVYATISYFFGDWPPGEKSFGKAIQIMSNMSVCHIKAYQLIHRMREDMGYHNSRVSFANHVRVFEPADNKNPWHRICTKLSERFFQGAITEAMCTGVFKWPLSKNHEIAQGEYCDFIAINYYTRTAVTGFGDGTKQNAPTNDLGWEIYPEGIVRCSEKLYQVLKRPIYITENGTCDNEDSFRCKYIYEHLKAVAESSLPIERYYHWCFCDNFEWIEGESARFGLVHVNYETQERTIKNSGEFYSKVIAQGGVTDELYNQYVKPQEYHY